MADTTATLEGIRSVLNVGARTYLFYWYPNLLVDDGERVRRLVRSTSLPASTLKVAEIPWQGYNYKIGAQQEFAEWTVNVNMDSMDTTRAAIIKWMEKIHNPGTNIHGRPKDYFRTQQVSLLAPDTLKPQYKYHLIDAWPSAVGEISLDYSGAEVATYDITFQIQRFEIDENPLATLNKA